MSTTDAPGPPGQQPTLLAVEMIRFDETAWPRGRLDLARIAEFGELYGDGGLDALDPIDVVPDGCGAYLIANGVHRYEAVQIAGFDAIWTVTIPLPSGMTPAQAAYQHAVATASKCAKPLTRSERTRAVVRLLVEQPAMSDRQIADLCGVSHQTVGRRRLELAAPSAPNADETIDTSRRRQHEEVVAKRLFKALEKVWEARGFGVRDFWAGRDRTGERLARVLADAYGEDALERAHGFQAWIDEAVSALSAGAE